MTAIAPRPQTFTTMIDAAGMQTHKAKTQLQNQESSDPLQGQPSQPVRCDSRQQNNSDFHAAWKPEGDPLPETNSGQSQ